MNDSYYMRYMLDLVDKLEHLHRSADDFQNYGFDRYMMDRISLRKRLPMNFITSLDKYVDAITEQKRKRDDVNKLKRVNSLYDVLISQIWTQEDKEAQTENVNA